MPEEKVMGKILREGDIINVSADFDKKLVEVHEPKGKIVYYFYDKDEIIMTSTCRFILFWYSDCKIQLIDSW